MRKDKEFCSRQMSFLTAEGAAISPLLMDAQIVDRTAGKYQLGGMRIRLFPTPKGPGRALQMTKDALLLFSQVWTCVGGRYEASKILMVKTEGGEDLVCKVVFRGNGEGGHVMATYRGGDKPLELSLPCVAVWKGNALDWLSVEQNCCAKGRANPRPWLGKVCSCVRGID